MAIKRKASAHWEGAGKTGNGTITTQSTVLDATQFSFNTRFADGIGTNPEELIAAAHAGCFSMKLSFVLNAAGFTAETIDTEAVVLLDTSVGAVTEIHLSTKVKCDGLDEDKFAECAKDAKENCPISKLMNATIIFNAELV